MTDILPTAYWGTDIAGIRPGDTVIVLGCGPVGLLAQKCAWLKGAKRVIAVDYIDYRLEHARRFNNVETVNFTDVHGGADVVLDCVGMDGKMSVLEMVETAAKLQGGSMSAIVMAAQAVRKGGTVALAGVYGARYNQFPLGDFFARNITLKMGQCPAQAYTEPLLKMILEEKIDPTDIITHKLP